MRVHLDTNSEGRVKLFLQNEEGLYTGSLTREQFVEHVLAFNLALDLPEIQDWVAGLLDERRVRVERAAREAEANVERLERSIERAGERFTDLFSQLHEADAKLSELKALSGS